MNFKFKGQGYMVFVRFLSAWYRRTWLRLERGFYLLVHGWVTSEVAWTVRNAIVTDCSDVCPCSVRLLARGRRPHTMSTSRRAVSRRWHPASDQQGRSQLVAGTSMGCTAVWAGRPCTVSRAAGMENGLCCHRESQTWSSRLWCIELCIVHCTSSLHCCFCS